MQLNNVILSGGRVVDLSIEDGSITAIEPSSGAGEHYVSP